MTARLALVALLLLAGCGDPPPESGTVVQKVYDDPDDWTVRVDDYAYGCQYEYGYNPSSGKFELANICKDRVVGSHRERRHDGPHWEFRVRDDKDPKHHAWVEVGPDIYAAIDVGGHWPDPR